MTDNDLTLLLVSGIPGAGKSTFSRWLATHHGYRYIHIDTDRSLDAAFRSPQVLEQVVSEWREGGVSIVLDWGFPPALIRVVRRLRDLGFSIWWFDGDRQAAKQSALSRPGADLLIYSQQMARMSVRWKEIEATFIGRVIQTVQPGPAYLGHEEILSVMRRS